MRRQLVLAVVAAVALAGAVAACGGRYRRLGPAAPELPVTRTPTAGEPALALLPDGIDVLIEIDLARARANPLIGPVVDGWIGALEGGDLPLDEHLRSAAAASDAPARRSPLAGAAWVVLAAYGVGGPDATTVTLLAPGKGVEVPGGVGLGDGVVALAPPAWIDRLRAVAPGARASDDVELLRLRSRAMPSAADGAVLRVTARLSDDARISLAGALGVEPAPRAVSGWADVADDAAVVLDLDSRDPGDPAAARRLRVALERFLHRIADRPDVRTLGLAPSVARTRIESSKRGTWLRTVTVINPGRLRWAVAQVKATPAEASP